MSLFVNKSFKNNSELLTSNYFPRFTISSLFRESIRGNFLNGRNFKSSSNKENKDSNSDKKHANIIKQTDVKPVKKSAILSRSLMEDDCIRDSLVVPSWISSMVNAKNKQLADTINELEGVEMDNDSDCDTKDMDDSGLSNMNNINRKTRNFSCFICNKYKTRNTKARFKVCIHVGCYHCLRKALQVEYWAVKKDIWENCRAVCPFCHVLLDWSKIKPFILLTPEAKEYPLMALCENEERLMEAYRVINAFFPKGVPNEVIFGQNVDFSVRPKVTQTLFGYQLEFCKGVDNCTSQFTYGSKKGGFENSIANYGSRSVSTCINGLHKKSLPFSSNSGTTSDMLMCQKVFDNDFELFGKSGMSDITTSGGEDNAKDELDFPNYYDDSHENIKMEANFKSIWNSHNMNYGSFISRKYCNTDNSNTYNSMNYSSNVYPDIFSSWRSSISLPIETEHF